MTRLRALLVALLIGIGLLVTPTVSAGAPDTAGQATFTLPVPSGRLAVGTTALHLIDKNRADPWKPDRRRELMVHVWYPARDAQHYPRQPWVDPAVAPYIDAFAVNPPVSLPSGRVDWASPLTYGHVNAPVDRRGKRPVVIFSPGFGSPTGPGSTLVQALVSHGYIVVAVEHTFETAVQFPGGRLELPVPIEQTPEGLNKVLDARVNDVRFVLDELPMMNRTVMRGTMDTTHIGIFGYSYGGFTSAESMYADRRITAGVDLDCQLDFGPGHPSEVAKHGLDRPFLLLGGQFVDANGDFIDHDRYTDPSWAQFWANQRGWKRDVTMEGTGHLSFSDLQTILPQLPGQLDLPPDKWATELGPIDPVRSTREQEANLLGFFGRFLR